MATNKSYELSFAEIPTKTYEERYFEKFQVSHKIIEKLYKNTKLSRKFDPGVKIEV